MAPDRESGPLRQYPPADHKALGTLDSGLRTVVCLVDVEGFSHREVAEMLQVPEGTVASRLFRARRELRDRLAATAHEVFHRRQHR